MILLFFKFDRSGSLNEKKYVFRFTDIHSFLTFYTIDSNADAVSITSKRGRPKMVVIAPMTCLNGTTAPRRKAL